ncbi:glycosyltransferase, partial [Acidianus sp. RZ1]|uniref:glycosyltransferase n=1 Tax=Acidianus sp. RZ1 TaxID=1540082 RepID=UPI00149303BF
MTLKILYVNFGTPMPSGATTTIKEVIKMSSHFGMRFNVVDILLDGERGLVETFPEIEDYIGFHITKRIKMRKDSLGKGLWKVYRKIIIDPWIRKYIKETDIVIGYPTSKSVNILYAVPYLEFPLRQFYLRLVRKTNLIDGTVWFLNSLSFYARLRMSNRNICMGGFLKEEMKKIYKVECEEVNPPAGISWQNVEKATPFEDNFDVIHFSRLGFMKGTPEAIEVMKTLKRYGFSRFAIAGPQDLDYSLQKDINGDRSFKYFGEIKDKTFLYSLIKSSKVFLYPTNIDSFGIVVAE